MKPEEVEEFLDLRKKHNYLSIDEWTNSDTQQKRFQICYWIWVGHDKIRVCPVANTLEEAVLLAQTEEATIARKQKEAKDAPGKRG